MRRRLWRAARAWRAVVGREHLIDELCGRAPGLHIGNMVEVRSPDRLTLAADVFVDSGVVLHCGGMDWSPPDGGISIGAGTYVGPNSVLFGAAGIEIGEVVLISPGVVITSHQHGYEGGGPDIRDQPLRFGKVVIERDVWIGANATILPGVRLGQGSVVGAGAVVTSDVPEGCVAVGVPARVIRGR